ncbi:hypothetical protein ROHU_004682 [Labeo rohita]|uniref:Uncharacterized protein n=1 Tax=Labeo rohita TaxID=84645 RepID=A0A498NK34_LABRO|nr:hypothetical protein ROHU_004682 [Labeo rohita]
MEVCKKEEVCHHEGYDASHPLKSHSIEQSRSPEMAHPADGLLLLVPSLGRVLLSWEGGLPTLGEVRLLKHKVLYSDDRQEDKHGHSFVKFDEDIVKRSCDKAVGKYSSV